MKFYLYIIPIVNLLSYYTCVYDPFGQLYY